MTTLPANATLVDLNLPRREAADFLRGAYNAMARAEVAFGELRLRIGITGQGIEPSYRFEDSEGRAVAAMDGKTHKAWPEGTAFAATDTWSTETMSLQDVERTFRELTGYSGPRPNGTRTP